jgi:hypothetical protein
VLDLSEGFIMEAITNEVSKQNGNVLMNSI